MSALFGARNARARFLIYGALACTIFGFFYLHTIYRINVLELQRCKVDQKAAHTQLSAVIEYKEQMEHSLAAERSQHEDSAAAFRNQQEEQDKLLHRTSLIENQYINLTKECEKMKKSVIAKQEIYDACKNQHDEAVAAKGILEEKLRVLTEAQEYINRENDRLRERLQLCEKTTVNKKSPYISINNVTKNFSQLVKESEDVYYILISTNKTTQTNNKNNIKNMMKVDNTSESIQNIVNKDNLKKSDIPHGVAPELSVDDTNINDKNLNTQLYNEENKGIHAIKTNDINKDEKLANPPNRYKQKLVRNGDDYPLKKKLDNVEENKFMNDQNRKSFNEESLLVGDSPIKDDIDDQKNYDKREKDPPNEDDTVIKREMKKEHADDLNLSRNNGESMENNEIREDDDDIDEYNYQHADAIEDPANKK